MSFEPFLQRLARHYATLPPTRLISYSFVFPNQRSGYFFNEYFKNAVRERGYATVIMPEIITMSSLVEGWSHLVEATQSELMTLMLRSYIDLTHSLTSSNNDEDRPLDIERFLYWSSVILNDFNDIDRSLADASHLYRNLKDIKGLQTNPLSAEQMEIVKHFWNTTGVDWLEETEGDSRMWINAIPSDRKEGVKKFLKLWEILGPLYDTFQAALKREGLCYIGMAYREAISKIEQLLDSGRKLHRDKFVFIGFSYLSNSEKKIFSLLMKHGHAMFHWDSTMPRLGSVEEFPLRLIKEYKRQFPEPADFDTEENVNPVEIEIYSVPSDIGQIKQVASMINNDKDLNSVTALRYGVVLPELSLCVPLLSSLSLPPGVDVNVTMGIPVKNLPVSSVMESIATMRVTADGSVENGRYYKPAVKDLLSQPLLMRCCGEECRNLLFLLSQTRGMYIKCDSIKNLCDKLSFLFNGGYDGTDVDSAVTAIVNDCDQLMSLYVDLSKRISPGVDASQSIEYQVLNAYRSQALEFGELIRKYELNYLLSKSGEVTFGIVEKMIRRMSLNFVGTPLKGIQILGILETRALDFEHLFITSMNERSFPRKMQTPTFIPYSLREAYGLSSRADEETVMAYHFYRLLGRAKRVSLLYNRNTDGLRSGEASRYIYQLKYLFKCPEIKEYELNYPVWASINSPIIIEKTPEVMNVIECYRSGNPSKKTLSASSLKKLFSCGLQFYLSKLCGYSDPDDDDLSHIDDGMYGTIVHTIMEEVYSSGCPKVIDNGDLKPKVTPAMLDNIVKGNDVEKLATRAINKKYLDRDELQLDEPLSGEMLIFRDLAVKNVKSMLLAEKKYMTDRQFSYFILEKPEESRIVDIDVGNGVSVKIKYVIDRVDRMYTSDGNSFIRIVDYKTGSDPLTFGMIDDLFDFSKAEEREATPQAIMQLMLYSIAYSLDPDNKVDESEIIQPVIYSFREVANGKGIQPITYNDPDTAGKKKSLEDYKDIRKAFFEGLSQSIHKLFDVREPFIMSSGKNPCKFCEFKEICGRDK